MLNVKEVTEHLKAEGIMANEQVVIRWILDGKLKAKRTKLLNLDFSIAARDLASFILDKKLEMKSKQYGVDYQQWEKTFNDNQKLKEQLEEVKSKLRIEQAKSRNLKKMLQTEYELSGTTTPLTLISFLGLEKDSEQELIKKEIKKILKALHPDRGGDERLFKVFYEHYSKV